MRFGKHRLGLIGLCVTAAFSLMAFSAAAAQAETPSWMIEGTTINLPAERTVNFIVEPEALPGTTEKHLVLLWRFSGSAISILCSTVTANNEKILGDGVVHGAASFSNCNTSVNGSPAGACKPKEPIVAKGLLLVVLHPATSATEGYVLAEPETGKPFTTITLGQEEECSLGENFEVRGQLWIEDCNHKATVEELVHLIQEGPLHIGLFIGTEPLTIDGSANVELFEGGVMKKFSILPA